MKELNREQIARAFLMYWNMPCVVNAEKHHNIKKGDSKVDYANFPAVFDDINRNLEIDQFLGVRYPDGLRWLDCFNKLARVYSDFVKTDDIKLLLKPLSAISDEDAIEVAKMSSKWEGEQELYRIKSEDFGYSFLLDIKIRRRYREGEIALNEDGYAYDSVFLTHYNMSASQFQYLISKGYSVPLLCLGGKTPIEAGLAVDASLTH